MKHVMMGSCDDNRTCVEWLMRPYDKIMIVVRSRVRDDALVSSSHPSEAQSGDPFSLPLCNGPHLIEEPAAAQRKTGLMS